MASFGFSQTIGRFDVSTNQMLDLGRRGDKGVEDVRGTQYFEEKYSKSKVSGYDDFAYLRYNAVQDEMEFEKGGDLYYIPKVQNMTVTFSDQKTYEYLNFSDKGNELSGYLVVLSKGDKYTVYKREQIKYISAKEATNSYDSGRPAEYKKADNTFFITAGEKAVNFPKNKKELLKMFPDQSTQISDYLKKNKVSFSKEVDLIDLTKFLNTL